MLTTSSCLDMELYLTCILVILALCSCRLCISHTDDRFIVTEDMTTLTHLDGPLATYCNNPVTITGSEGVVKEGHTLKEVHVILTPGFTDVSSNVKVQGHSYPLMSCNDENQNSTWLKHFKSSSHAYKLINHNPHFNPFHPTFPRHCSYNHLTLPGLQQMIFIGQHLHASYLSNHVHKKLKGHYTSTYVQSIPSQPSYHSLLAFLHGFLTEKQLHKTKIHESRGDFCNHNAVNLSTCNCVKMRELSRYAFKSSQRGTYMFKDGSFPDKELIHTLLDLDNSTTASGMELLQLLMQYKCDLKSTSTCMSHKHCHLMDDNKLLSLHNTVAKSLVKLYADIHFREHSELRIYPFLEELISHARNHDSIRTVNIYMGDKHFMQYLLTTLNIFNQHVMPMASRLILEIYKKNTGHTDDDDLYVRLLYNGEDITERLLICSYYLENGLCPLNRFELFLSALRTQYMNNCWSS